MHHPFITWCLVMYPKRRKYTGILSCAIPRYNVT